jgi:hypothetical protein
MYFINHWLAWVLTSKFAVPSILIAFFVACTSIIIYNYVEYHRGNKRALQQRLAALESVILADSTDEAHRNFATSYDQIDAAMSRFDGSPGLVHAWIEYSQTIVGQDEEVLKATTRPYEYFLHLGDDTRVLAWWANIFVALGLTFTFLGIIAALTQTTDNMRNAGANSAGMADALVILLTITAAKFWTSVAGVLASIALRWIDRRWHSASLRQLTSISDAIERGTVFLPPQRVAVEQLFQLEQQTKALSEFSTKLAVGIADALGEKMQPVVIGLSGIQASIDEFKSGSFDQIGKELGEAISQGAGTEMESLAAALTGMTDNLRSVNDRLDTSGQAASDQIASAAREFSAASDAMTKAFTILNDRIEGIGTKMAAQIADSAERSASHVAEERAAYQALADGNRETMRSLANDLQTASAGALDTMRAQLSSLGETLTKGVADAADRNSSVLAQAAAALEQATAQTAVGMKAAIADTFSEAAAQSERAISAAFSQFGEKFELASAGLVETLRTTAGRMESLAASIEQSTGAADSHATKLSDAGREAQSVAAMLGRAASDVQAAMSPVREATAQIQQSVGRTQELLRQSAEHDDRHTQAVEAVASSLEQTSGAAGRAWADYRERFEGVDKALGEALDKMTGASAEHAGALNEHIGRIDKALAQAVDRLQASLDPLADLAQSLEDARSREGAR